MFLARFVAGLRVFGVLVAGVSRKRWRTFLFFNALRGVIWATAAVLVGYLLGGSLDLVDRWVARTSLLLLVLLGVALTFYVAYRWVAGHRRQLLEYANAVLPTGSLSPVALRPPAPVASQAPDARGIPGSSPHARPACGRGRLVALRWDSRRQSEQRSLSKLRPDGG